MSAAKIRVGFVVFGIHLLGMHNYLRNLIAAIDSLPGKPIQPVVFLGQKQLDFTGEFVHVEVVRSSLLDRMSPAWMLRKSMKAVLKKDLLLQRLLLKHGVTVLSHSGHLGHQTEIKTVGWMADLQHIHLPELFGAKEVELRNLQFHDLFGGCDRVITSSECGRADLETFDPGSAPKAEVLRFVSRPSAMLEALSLEELQTTYAFDEPYFVLPNQFWAHKNHGVVIEALAHLAEEGKAPLVFATGSTKGHPDPDYLPSLLRRAKEGGVEDRFRVLGIVPFDHLIGLMRNSIAVVNPSRFEGWSTSVEESKSMGKQIVLSDIPVHREQAPERSYYFSPDDPAALASRLVEAKRHWDVEEDKQIQDAVLAGYPERLRAFGYEYLRIVQELAQQHD